MKRMILTLAAAAGVLYASQTARATLLVPGGPSVPVSATVAGGTVIATATDSFQIKVGANILDAGTVTETVVKGDPGNLLGGLDFDYQVTVTKGIIDELSLSDFSPAIVNAEQYLTKAGQIAAATANMDTFGNVNVNFPNNALVAGKTSYVIVLETNKPAYVPGTIGLIDSGGTTVTPAFAPSPEPTSLVLLGGCFAGLCGMGLLRLRRRKSASAV